MRWLLRCYKAVSWYSSCSFAHQAMLKGNNCMANCFFSLLLFIVAAILIEVGWYQLQKEKRWKRQKCMINIAWGRFLTCTTNVNNNYRVTHLGSIWQCKKGNTSMKRISIILYFYFKPCTACALTHTIANAKMYGEKIPKVVRKLKKFSHYHGAMGP